jgi:hypothetical protein
MQGVVRHGSGALTGWFELNRGAIRDKRSSANPVTFEFLSGYDCAVATNDFGAVVWIEVRNSAVCPAIDAYRQSLVEGAAIARPRPQLDCDARFGNTDTFSRSGNAPTEGTYGTPPASAAG